MSDVDIYSSLNWQVETANTILPWYNLIFYISWTKAIYYDYLYTAYWSS